LTLQEVLGDPNDRSGTIARSQRNGPIVFHSGGATIRAPQRIKSGPNEQVVFDRYDGQNFGYLRIIVSSSQLRIEYRPASDGPSAKTPDDSMTVDLQTHRLTTYDAPDLGQPWQARETAKLAKEHPLRYGRRR
jgi:hypothetical protein